MVNAEKKTGRQGALIALIALLVGIAFLAYPTLSYSASTKQALSENIAIARISYDEQGIPVIPYEHEARAPEGDVGGLWLTGKTPAGMNYAHIIGHNPGVFSFVMSLTLDDCVELCAVSNSSIDVLPIPYAEYKVVDFFDVPKGTTSYDIEQRMCGSRDMFVLQTCCDIMETTYRIVLCKLI